MPRVLSSLRLLEKEIGLPDQPWQRMRLLSLEKFITTVIQMPLGGSSQIAKRCGLYSKIGTRRHGHFHEFDFQVKFRKKGMENVWYYVEKLY